MKLTKLEWKRVCGWMAIWLAVLATAPGWKTDGQTTVSAATTATVSTTTVQGTVYAADGSAATGTAHISWPAFTTASSLAVVAGQMDVSIGTDGFVSVNLAPNSGATPAGLYYTVVYHLSDGTTSTEYWVVPSAAQATIASVRATLMPSTQAVQAVSKTYVDSAVAALGAEMVPLAGGTMTGALILSEDPTVPLEASDKHYVDEEFAKALPLTGGTLSGALILSGDPTASLQAADKKYVDAQASSAAGGALRVDQFTGANFGAKLQACVNALDGTYGGTCDARNFTGAQTMSSNLTISTANATVLLPCATITSAYQMIVPAGIRNVTLKGCGLRGGSASSGTLGGTAIVYTGSAAAIQVGDATYAKDTPGFHLDDVVINTVSSSSSSAGAFTAYRAQELDVKSVYMQGNANQTALVLDGTGNYTGGTLADNQIVGYQVGLSAIGHQATNTATTDWMNASNILRLHIACPTSSSSPIDGTIGIDLQAGDGNTFTGGDVEGCDEAMHLGASAKNNTILGLRNENSNSQVVADSGSAYNSWITGGTMFTGKLTDNGTRNSFMDTFHRSFNGMNGDWYGSQKDATVTNHYRLGIGLGNERGLLDRYQTDAGYRWTMGLTDATAGAQYYGIQDELNNVYRLSIGQYNDGSSSTNNQTVVNAAGTGAVVLNGSTNAGTGGVVIGSGGTSPTTVATISSSGNAVLTGTLQVNGTSTFLGSTSVRNSADAEIDQFLWAGSTANQKESFTYKDYAGTSQWYMVKDASNNWALNSAVGGLDSFKAYQSTNSGDTYINAARSTGVVRVNYESGAGTAFNIYGGSSSTLYASFTGTSAIKFPGIASSTGRYCLQIDASGYLSNTGSTCGTGNTNGTVYTGTLGQIAYYSGAGTAIAGESQVPASAGGTALDTSSATGVAQVASGTWTVSTALPAGTTATTQTSGDSSTKVATTAYVDTKVIPLKTGGTGATTAAAALTNLGAVPLAGGTMTGTLLTPAMEAGGSPWFDVTYYGAAGDGRMGSDGVITSGATSFTSSTMSCSDSDVGKILTVTGAGDDGEMLVETITSCSDSTTVNFSAAASESIADGATWFIGTDNTTAFKSAIQAALNACGGTIYVPQGTYFVNGELRIEPTSTQVAACPAKKGSIAGLDLHLLGAGSRASLVVQNNATATLMSVHTYGYSFFMEHIGLLGRGKATTGNLFEDWSPGTVLSDVYLAGTGGRGILQEGERLTTYNLLINGTRQAMVQGYRATNESYFYNTHGMYIGNVFDPMDSSKTMYYYNVNASSGTFPSSGTIVPDMHAAFVLGYGAVNSGTVSNNLWEGGSIKATGKGMAGIRVLAAENFKLSHLYIEGYDYPRANPSVIYGGVNEKTTTTAKMTTSSTSVAVKDAKWMGNVLGSTVDLPSADGFPVAIYPPDYVYGSTATSSIGTVTKGTYEMVYVSGWVNNVAYIYKRAQGGTSAVAWPVGAVIAEQPSLYTTSAFGVNSADPIVLEDDHLNSFSSHTGYTVTEDVDNQQPAAEVILGYVPDRFHTWSGASSDYTYSPKRSIYLTGNTRLRWSSSVPGQGTIEIQAVGSVYKSTDTGDLDATGLNFYGSASSNATYGTGGIQANTYASGKTSSYAIYSPSFVSGLSTSLNDAMHLGNAYWSTNSSNQATLYDASTNKAVCNYNGSKFTCTGTTTGSVSYNASSSTTVQLEDLYSDHAVESCSGAITIAAPDASSSDGDTFELTVTAGTSACSVTWSGFAASTPALTVPTSGIETLEFVSVNSEWVVAGTEASTLFGSTLSSSVTASSLTSVGTLASLKVSGTTTLSGLTAAGLVANSAAGVLSTTTALPSGATATTQATGDASTKVATDAFVAAAVTNATVAGFSGALTGDVTGTQSATVVNGINGTTLSGLATGLLKNTTGTGVPKIAVAGTDYVAPSGSITGNAATATALAAASVLPNGTTAATQSSGDASTAVATDAFVVMAVRNGTASGFSDALSGDVTGTQNGTVVNGINGTTLSGLATGLLKNTTSTGVPTIAVAGTDYVTPSGSITGNAATATALAATPAACGAGYAPTGVLANGNATGCTALPSGTVSSVGLAIPGSVLYTVSGSPVSTSGTLTLTPNTQTANTVLAGPSSGTAAAAPSFRSLVAADLPASITSSTTGSAASLSAASALPSGTTATTQSTGDSSTKVATTAFAEGVGATVPSWLRYLGDGSDGSYTASGSVSLSGEKYYTNFSVPYGSTLTTACSQTYCSLVIHATGACTIAGTLTSSGMGSTSNQWAGGAGGGGGGGTAAGSSGYLVYYTSVYSTYATGGTASGGAGGTVSVAPVVSSQRAALASGLGQDLVIGGGSKGGQGGSSGGAGGAGAPAIVLICGSITGTDGTNTGTISANGAAGTAASANSTGGGGGGGGGILVLSSQAAGWTATFSNW